MAPGNQMTGLMNGGVGILPQCDISVNVAPGRGAAGHDHGGKGDGLIPPHDDNTPQKGVAPNSSGRTGHNTSHNGVVGHPYMIVPSLSRRQICFLLLMMANALTHYSSVLLFYTP